ncbi:MAG: tetratricopeptide repeat protein [Hyphomicrobiaceae bacterium]|nr:tetratricopeptide repeat protein [Hyphomicrobiaceae bacterium]
MASPPRQPMDKTLAEAITLHKQGQFEQAYKSYRKFLNRNPAHPDALVLGGQAAFLSGREKDALRWLKSAAKNYPDNPDTSYNLGVLYQSLGDTHKALDAFRAAVKAGPGFAPAHYNLAMALHELGQAEEALKHFDQAVAAEPRHAEAHASKAYVLRMMGRIPDAIQSYKTSLDLSERNAKAWVGLGSCLQEVNKLEDAFTAHRNGMAVDPDYPDAASNLADVLVQMDRPEDAIRACDTYLSRHPGDAAVLAAKSIALNEAGERDAYAGLVDLERFVRPIRHDPPEGYDTIDAFNTALNDHVTSHPTLVDAPASHTTMNGKQTGSINAGLKGPVEALEALIEKGIEHYMSGVADAQAHPTVAHRPAKYELSIWGTVLEGEGFQAPHIHPSGWLSGVYYPQVPKIVEDEENKFGWIEFGQPGPEYHFSKTTELRLVKPEPGMMVMFPSYMFHRTIPFQSNETRISIAFDVVPV